MLSRTTSFRFFMQFAFDGCDLYCAQPLVLLYHLTPGFVISIDSWTSYAANSVVAVTYRFMDDKNDVHELVLDALPLNRSHSAAYLSSCVLNRLDGPDQLLFSSSVLLLRTVNLEGFATVMFKI